MTSDQTEDYQYHRTNTPESPRPIYPPEPANIPVLKNMNDPAFTDASTYDIRPSSQLHAVHGGSVNGVEQQGVSQNNNAGEPARAGTATAPSEDRGDTAEQNDSMLQMQSYGLQAMSIPVDTQYSYDSFAPNVQNSAFAQPDFELSHTLETLAKTQSHATPGQNDRSTDQLPDSTVQTSSSSIPTQQRSAGNTEGAYGGFAQSVENNTRGEGHRNDGVNYQSLLDTLTRSTSAAASAENIGAQTATNPSHNYLISPSTHDGQLPSAVGLPPRPPTQERFAVAPNYSQTENNNLYSQTNAQNAPPQMYQSQTTNSLSNTGLPQVPLSGNAPGTSQGSNGLPPPPLATFQQGHPGPISQNAEMGLQGFTSVQMPADQSSVIGSDDGEQKWGPEVQIIYDQFLSDERKYVTEGVWDRFPIGSRMFLGNLPTEKVTKRDIFNIFHKHGKLAQISIKQAYGFVQFLEATDCFRALEAEQGVSIRGRRLHLEISKPQKNTRNAGGGENARQTGRKRSRSPEKRRRAQDRGHDARVPFSDYRDEPHRRRDDYRPPRSPSPRNYRARDEYRSRDNNQYYRGNERSRSPFGRSNTRHRSPSPRSRDYDSEADLPIPRRHRNDVPDVQIIVLDDVDRNFIEYLENGLRSKALQCQTLMLGARFPLAAVVKRQIIEGVQAIIKLTRSSQYNGKIPLQVFDRSAGIDVRFNEYVDLDILVAAEIVLQNKRNQRPAYPSAQTYGSAPTPAGYGQHPSAAFPPTPSSTNPNVANMISNLDGPALQKLLGAMQQQQTSGMGQLPISTGAPAASGTPDLASLLTSVARQQQQNQQQQQGYAGQSLSASTPFSPSTPQAYMGGAQYPSSQQPPQNVQNIMDHLGRYRR